MNHLTKNAFPEVRQPGDPDAVAEITAILQAAGHPTPTAWESDSLIQEAKPAAPKLQRFLINRYWRLKLASLEPTVHTQAERYCLIDDDIKHEDYIRVFGEHVAPTLVKHQL